MVSEEEITSKYEEFENLRQAYLLIENKRQKVLQDLAETENALKELSNLPDDKKVYFMIGNVLIEKDKKELINKLNEDKEILKVEAEKLKKQSDIYKEKLNSLTKELNDLLKKSNLQSK